MNRIILQLVVCLIILLLLTAFCAAWLWYIRHRPAEWAARVDRVGRFDSWLLPASIAEKLRRFEKGKGFQMLVALALTVCAAGFLFGLVMAIGALHRAGIL